MINKNGAFGAEKQKGNVPMKKIFAILMTVCLMVSMLCVSAFAAEPSAVMKVQYGSEVKEFSNFEDGWNYAMEQANDEKEVYVTLLADWIAVDGCFSDDFINGDGFSSDTIYFNDDVTMTLDLNGHTIDRGLTVSEIDGEVIFINDDANVTIKNGTIKGGYSNNGAGGIHIEGANVSLIDLVFTGNSVHNDDGAALQHVGGGELYMKNCRFVGNDGSPDGFDIFGTVYLNSVDKVLIEDCYFADNDNIDYGAGIYAETCNDFVIKNSTFENLHAGDRGGAIWVFGGEADNSFNGLSIYNCKFNNNTAEDYGGAIYAKSAELFVYDSKFIGNYSEEDGGAVYLNGNGSVTATVPSYFYRCTFDGNRAGEDGGAICSSSGMSVLTKAKTYGCDFINNTAGKYGGAVCLNMECGFEFFSDDETGKVGTIKNNTAGELGGGVYQGAYSHIRFGGEIYASENTSSAGNDDIYIKDSGKYIHLGTITSPEGSIGIRYKDDDGGRFTDVDDENKNLNPKVFFLNNEGLEVVRGEYRYSNMDDTMIPCWDIAKKTSAVGSIFGEGSLSMIVALLALIASGVSIFLTVYYNKKKAAPVAANNVTEAEDEE